MISLIPDILRFLEAIREKKVMDDDTEQALIKAIEECKSSSVRRLDISRRQVVKWLRCET